MRHIVSQSLALAAVAAGLQFSAISAHAQTAAASTNDRIVVMISVDGLAGYYLDDPKADMPHIRALATNGARAASMKASTPTVTWPNHTTLVTGDNPARHGVLGNNYYDRTTGKKVQLISDPVYDKDEIVKVPTIYDAAKAAGLKTMAVRWPASRNAKIDWTTPDIRTEEDLLKYTTPGLLDEAKSNGLVFLDGHHSTPANNIFDLKDALWTKIFNVWVHDHRPQLALLHIFDVDHTEHMFGPKSPEAYQAIHDADNYVGEVWDEIQKDFPGHATLVLVSDHGFSAIKRQVLPIVLLKKAGVLKPENGKIHFVSQGGSEFIYLDGQTNREEVVAEIHKAFKGVKGVARVVDSSDFKEMGVADPKEDPHVPDIILFSDDGVSFGDTANGSLPFNEKPERKGSHGHDANYPNLHATFVMGGAGVKPGVNLGEISNIDVAPTLAKLLGIDFPNTDGKPLSAGLVNP